MQVYDDGKNASEPWRPMNMTSHEARDAEALATLSEYLELSLDKGKNLILVRGQSGKSDVYLGEPDDPQLEWVRCGSIQNTVASAILEATRSGLNELAIQGQTYRFVRMFTQVLDQGGVVFAAA